MTAKKYRIDGEPASARDIIDRASDLSERYANAWLKMSSEAARILRQHGHVVDHNPDWVEEEVTP